jgi:hypothetical protein
MIRAHSTILLQSASGESVVAALKPLPSAAPDLRSQVMPLTEPEQNPSGDQPRRIFSGVFGSMSILLHLFEHAAQTGFPALPDAVRDHTPLHYVIHVWNDLARTA